MRATGALVGLACAVLILGPTLKPGFILHYDMVFVPRLGIGHRTLGIDGGVPRAVPNDLVAAVLSVALPGWLVQKLLLVTVFVGVGAGMGLLVRSRSAAAAAAVAACWNPFVAERLAIGHWGFLLGYATIPWVAAAAARLRDDQPGGASRTALTLSVSAATGSTGAVYGLIVALAVVLTGRSPRTGGSQRALRGPAVIVVTGLLVNAPWWWPYVSIAGGGTADRVGVTAFAARADTPWGVLGSLATLGGIWNDATSFSERSSWLISGLALLAVLALVAWWTLTGRPKREPTMTGLAVAALVGIVIAWLPVVTPTAMEWFVVHVPGGGLLRDSQKFVAMWAVWVAAATGEAAVAGCRALAARGAPRLVAVGLGVAAALWPVVTLPTLAWAAGGRWHSVSYPRSMLVAAAKLNHAQDGAVAVFPWRQYRRYAWNDDTVVLDPWQRLVSRDVVVNDDLQLRSGIVVAGESSRARAIGAAVGSAELPAVLKAQGVRWVVIETDQPGQDVRVADLPTARVVSRSADLTVLDLGVRGVRVRDAPPWTAWLGLVTGCASMLIIVVVNVGYTGRRTAN